MQRTGATSIAAVLLLTATSGCGTMQNMKGQPYLLGNLSHPTRPPRPFGGTIMDVESIALIGSGGLFNPENLVFAPIALIDLPLSFAGDVVTLPWATYEFINEWRNPSDRYRFQFPPFIAEAEKGPVPATESSAPGNAPNLQKRD